MRRRVVEALVGVTGLVGLLVSLSARASAQRAPVDARVRAQIDLDLEHEMRVPRTDSHYSAALPALFPFYHDSVLLNRERSRAVPGMTYTWGVYRPPKTGDILFTTLAGDAKERITTLVTPSDWWRLASVLSWQPASDDDAIAGCGELISYVGPRRSASIRPLAYLGTQSLKRVEKPLRESLKKSELRPPVVARVDGGVRYRVELWAIESGRLAKYHCEIGRSAPMLVATDSLDGRGFFSNSPE
ncbi:MAG: hypothetical protein ABI884_12260 [Gemmatimonadota bacterium]